MFKPVDLRDKLIKVRKKELKKEDVLNWVNAIFSDVDFQREITFQKLQNSENNTINTFDLDKLESSNIFSIHQINKICIDYRLRFLDTKYFKGDYPTEVISKIQNLEKLHNTKLEGFKIVAPSVLFKFKKADDPMLFVPLGNNYFYLIHKWGNDLHPLRRIKYWSVKNVENFGIALFVISILLTFLTQTLFFRDKTSFIYFVLLFLFYFKGAVGFGLYIGIASGKNFSEYSWQSKYDKIS